MGIKKIILFALMWIGGWGSSTAQNIELYKKNNTQPGKFTYLRCYYKSNSPDYPALATYAWAKTKNNLDWFRIYGKWWNTNPVSLSNMFFSDSSQEDLKKACRHTLKDMGLSVGLLGIAAADNVASRDYTIWTNDKSNQTSRINKIIAFGDSMSDTGNMFNASAWTFPNKYSWAHGRMTDGKVWVEYMSEFLSIPVYSWAFSGAGIDDDQKIPGVLRQIESWKRYMQSAPNYRPENTLFTFLAGGNDFLVHRRDTNTVIESTSKALRRLIDAGARNIIVLKIPDFSRSPNVRKRNWRGSMAEKIIDFNVKLEILVNRLLAEYGADVNIMLYDTQKSFDELMNNPLKYGIDNVTDPCLQVANNWIRTWVTSHKQNAECKAGNQHMFWDVLHPTTYVHAILAMNVTLEFNRKANFLGR